MILLSLKTYRELVDDNDDKKFDVIDVESARNICLQKRILNTDM